MTPAPRLLFNYSFGTQVTQSPIVADGVVVFVGGGGSKVYEVNAIYGNNPITINSQSNVVGTPAIYHKEILFANASGYMNAFTENGLKIWSKILPVTPTGPLAVIGGNIGYPSGNTIYLVSAANGTSVANAVLAAPAHVPAFYSGELLVSTNSTTAQNYLYSYSLNGGSLTANWRYTLSTSPTTQAAVGRNLVAVGSGNTLYILTTGGNSIAQLALDTQIYGQLATANTSVYAYSLNKLYSVTVSGANTVVVGANIVSNAYNSIPSYSYGTIYISSNTVLRAFSAQKISSLWNATFFPQAGYPNIQYSAVAMAYGNAYVTYGYDVYAFGSVCSVDPGLSELAALGYMYQMKQGTCASLILNKTLPGYNTGIFVNNTYGPDLNVPNFNGIDGNYSIPFSTSQGISKNFTVAAWVYDANTAVTRADVLNFLDTFTNIQSGKFCFYATGINSGYLCTSQAAIPQNKWTFVAVTVAGTAETLYVNGANSGFSVYAGSGTPTSSTGSIGICAYCGYNHAGNTVFKGRILDIQTYNAVLSSNAVQTLYREGAFGFPLPSVTQISWWPLNGDGNDYAGSYVAYPYHINYSSASYTPQGLSNAYEVARQSTLVGIPMGGSINSINVGVVLWR